MFFYLIRAVDLSFSHLNLISSPSFLLCLCLVSHCVLSLCGLLFPSAPGRGYVVKLRPNDEYIIYLIFTDITDLFYIECAVKNRF